MRYGFFDKRIYFGVTLCLLAVFLTSCSMQKSKLDSAHSENRPDPATKPSIVDAAVEKPPLKVDYLTPLSAIKSPEIFIYKEKRRMYVIQSNVLVRDYPIGLGFRPQGDKEKEGDGRTPEGEFAICVKNPASQFQKSLGLTYPDRKHAERAFFAGVLTPNEFRNILLASENGDKPPWNTQLGGQIFIHSGGAHKDWTNGCIALYNSDMDELFRIAGVGTPVIIRP